jgi:hypothetical protein
MAVADVKMGMGWVTPASNQRMCNIWKPASLERRQLKLVIEKSYQQWNGMEMSVLASFNVLRDRRMPSCFSFSKHNVPSLFQTCLAL